MFSVFINNWNIILSYSQIYFNKIFRQQKYINITWSVIFWNICGVALFIKHWRVVISVDQFHLDLWEILLDKINSQRIKNTMKYFLSSCQIIGSFSQTFILLRSQEMNFHYKTEKNNKELTPEILSIFHLFINKFNINKLANLS